ncbi:MAG: glycosyltransferase, partial [Pirellulaceae bacterium]
MSQHIALISEHASPLSALGGVDSGGQNVYVGQVARHLSQRGFLVDVFTRRDTAELPPLVSLAHNLRVIHVPAGPPSYVAKEDMLDLMPGFTRWMEGFIRAQGRYDLIHANFFMSGLVAADLKRRLDIPFVITFHALGKVRLQHQGVHDRFPRERPAMEGRLMEEADAIIAECPQDQEDQCRLYGADPAKMRLVPCGFDRGEMYPVDRREARQIIGVPLNEPLVMHIGRMVPRKGVDSALEGFARLIHVHKLSARMMIVGGESEEPDPRLTPEIGRLSV